MKKRILVLGATGLLGKPVACALQREGYQVRVFTRNIQKAQAIFDESFEIVAGDLLDDAELKNAMKDCYGVHISLPTEVEQKAAELVGAAAGGLDVKRITFISGASVAEENRAFPMIERKLMAEKSIVESGVPFSILCPTWVMESLPMFVNQGKANTLGKQPCPYHWVAAEDIAAMVVNAYADGKGQSERCVVHGPQAILMHDALTRYCSVFHPQIKSISTMPLWLARALAGIMNDAAFKFAVQMMVYFEKVGEGNLLPQPGCRLGDPKTTLDEWMLKRKEIQRSSLS